MPFPRYNMDPTKLTEMARELAETHAEATEIAIDPIPGSVSVSGPLLSAAPLPSPASDAHSALRSRYLGKWCVRVCAVANHPPPHTHNTTSASRPMTRLLPTIHTDGPLCGWKIGSQIHMAGGAARASSVAEKFAQEKVGLA